MIGIEEEGIIVGDYDKILGEVVRKFGEATAALLKDLMWDIKENNSIVAEFNADGILLIAECGEKHVAEVIYDHNTRSVIKRVVSKDTLSARHKKVRDVLEL